MVGPVRARIQEIGPFRLLGRTTHAGRALIREEAGVALAADPVVTEPGIKPRSGTAVVAANAPNTSRRVRPLL